MVANKKAESDLGPPEAVADEYCKIPEDQLSGGNYATQVKPQTFDEVVQFYEKEMDRRRGKVSEEDNSRSDKLHRHDDDTEVSDRELPIATVQVTQQILSTTGGDKASDRWLFDTGADIDATNNSKNFRPGTVVELRPGQFPIQTGNGTVHAESMGEVWLPLTGPNGRRSTMRLKYVAFLKDFPLNVVSGERFYRKGGRLKDEQIVDPNGEVLSHICAERRGFFLWLYNHPEPIKLLAKNKSVSTITAQPKIIKERYSEDEASFIRAYQACFTNGCFVMSDDVMKRLTLWHRRLCHPSAERLRWTIKNSVGIDLEVSDIKNLPCKACDMGKSLKYTTNQRLPR
ncbi:hypothetical protein K3495_g15807, partial [Podosphaera aphanis]